ELWGKVRFGGRWLSVRGGGGGGGGGCCWCSLSDAGGGGELSPAEIQRALLKGEAFVERGARTYLLDAGAIESMQGMFADCEAREGKRPGQFRLPGVYASYVKSSLDALDGVDVEATPGWLEAARRMNREVKFSEVEPIPSLRGVLRPYQRDGLNWLVFMERAGLGGILADEMGLGKTLQTLAWIAHVREDATLRGVPGLIVCPTSLVENWAEEAAKFTPHLRVLLLHGGDRHERFEGVAEADLVITSYALLRRDIERYREMTFSLAALDEAQHIKNRATQNAQAARQIRAHHRLVLTGTPIENSVSDLWSIMDFLMPGYLGRHDDFRANYELPISRGGQEAEQAQGRLRRKLHPFLLRRLKKDVAKDLPPKIERVAFCRLTADQRAVYKEVLEASRRRISDLVSAQGFNRSRMEIFKTLLQLRQISCHLDLLKLRGVESKAPSAKLDLFLELLDEAVDGGHRVLVFSQFVSMLTILREALEARGLTYCYLDGSTKERMKEVHRFNSDRSVPVFLISLKAGGTGLNLTGADMVIHFDPWWNPAVENQATDRAYRIGQKRTVYSIKLIAKDTVEEKVLAMQQRKKMVIDATLESDEQVLEKMSWEDVKELLEG
ncbi:MAG TPA: DEAD/DEAH box helicase, partial [Kiritimatiellia bacterium]|nr:DEAD/DEAH box helicase [Kiritimatiellia bacterium]